MLWTIPGGVLLMVAVGVYELIRHRRRRRGGTPITATYVNELTAMFYGTKRDELDHRQSMSMMREDQVQGAPPPLGIDLDRGTAVLRPEDRRPT
ncbi:DUF6191 domain-containing protein [Crossiella sp. CA198]|uniref:DUF6191 domain-containing protein n=1 Tax=Crossiella sp. CA198 TaxID=3455607 RepID=UPI003F8D5D7E